MPIQAICFDADGVIVNPALEYARVLTEDYGITRETTFDFFKGPFEVCLDGKARLENVLPPYLKKWGYPHSPEKFIHDWMVADHVIDQRVVDTVRQLRGQGFICCLATNQEHTRAAYMRNKMGFEDIFDPLFISSEIGAQKPQPAYYEHIEKALGLSSESLLFFDDAPKNITAARQRGWHAEVYTTFEAFQSDLKKHI